MTFPKNKDDHEGKIDKGEGSPSLLVHPCFVYDLYSLHLNLMLVPFSIFIISKKKEE